MQSKYFKWYFALFAFIIFCECGFAQYEHERLDIKDFGSISDTNVISTKAFQTAIDSAFFRGGGTVFVPSGDYCIGTIVLKENVTLYLDEGATIYASRDINDYRMPLKDAVRPVLVYANGANKISIVGKGRIEGRARHTYEDLKKVDSFIKEITENARQSGVEMKQYYVVGPDVSLVNFVNCDEVKVEGISLNESSWWSLHMVQCDLVEISDVKINTSLEKGVNADGIDINSCRNVNISNCQVFTGDDAIVLKTRYEDPCENIIVKNCVLSSSSTALKLGTESHGDFRNIRFENCQIKNSNRGLSIVVREGGNVENVVFSNITIECSRRHFNWWGNADPIWIYITQKDENSKLSTIKNVVFENIVAIGMGTSRIESSVGQVIENVKFSNVYLRMQPENYLDKRSDHALVISDVNGMEIDNLTIEWDSKQVEENWKNAVYIKESQDVKINNFNGRQGLEKESIPAVSIHNSSNISIENYVAPAQVMVAVVVSGEKSKDVVLKNVSCQKKNSKILSVGNDVVDYKTIRLIQ